MADSLKNLFSASATRYRCYRPSYPASLFSWLATMAPARELAWDCATGSGQSAKDLARYFQRVTASDASAQQIKNAQPCEGVNYQLASAEDSGLKTSSVDLITVAQALHWFDIDAFAREVSRVLRPDGVLAVWTYNLLEVSSGVDAVIRRLYSDILTDCWPRERRMVENGYRDIYLPFEEIRTPVFGMWKHWALDELLGYLDTWSAVTVYQQRFGNSPLNQITEQLAQAWGPAGQVREVRWPLSVRLWRMPASDRSI